MLYCPIASGSKGNCHIVSGTDTVVLVDAGTTARNISQNLASLGVKPANLSGILITHEHIDHIAALCVLEKQCHVPIYCNRATAARIMQRFPDITPDSFCCFNDGESFYINELDITPFSTSHDAADPVGYSLCCGASRMAIVTDTGFVSHEVMDRLRGAALVCLEANHDEEMLMRGSYPFTLKRRILGKKGHLCNSACADTLCQLAGCGIKQAVLAHLSEENNTPELALTTVTGALSGRGCDLPVDIAFQSSRGCCYNIEKI